MEVVAEGFANESEVDTPSRLARSDLIVQFGIEATDSSSGGPRAAERRSSVLAAAGDESGGVVAAFGFVGEGFDVGVGDGASG